jgi:signal transduction histidine kinase
LIENPDLSTIFDSAKCITLATTPGIMFIILINHIKEYLLMTLVFLLISSSTCGQSESTETLIQRVYDASSDEEKLDAILEACQRNDINSEKFNELAFMSESLAERSGDTQKKGLSAYNIAWAHYLSSNNDSARLAIDNALQNLDLTDLRFSDIEFKLRSFKATTFQSEQNNTEALRILYPLLEDVRKKQTKIHIAQTMHLIAIVESQQKNALKAIEWERQALSFLNENSPNANNVRSTVLATLGKAWMQLNNLDSAIYYNNMAIENFSRNDDLYNLAITLQRQARLYTDVNDLSNAEATLNKLSQLNENIHMGDGDMNYWMAFIHYYIQSKKYDQAIDLIHQRLEKAGENSERNATKWGIRLAYYEALAECYKAMQNPLQYATVLEKIVIAKDSLYELNSSDAIAEIQTKYEVQKRENTIIEQKLQLSQKNAFMYGVLIFFVLISSILWLHFRSKSRRQKFQMHIQMREDQLKAEQAVREAEENERKRIAADLHDNLGSYAASIVSNIQHLENSALTEATLSELKGNSQAMISLLNDTIWALKKDKLVYTAISDRVKLLLQRVGRSYPEIQLDVIEEIEVDILLQPGHAYHLFSIIHEAINNALKHSGADSIQVCFKSRLDNKPLVQIVDNGSGRLENLLLESGNGLMNMRHRAGSMQWDIEWQQNSPTGITVVIAKNNTN